MKNEFMNFLNMLMNACPEVVEEQMTDDVKAYINALMATDEPVKKLITDNGKMIIEYMRDNISTITWKSRDLANGLGISSRTVSGSMRKLVADGFVEKIGSNNPFSYALTEKGKIYNLDINEE